MASGQSYPRVNSARTHDEARQAVCCVCGKKPKQYKDRKAITVISDKQCELERQFVCTIYSKQNTSHPTALCYFT